MYSILTIIKVSLIIVGSLLSVLSGVALETFTNITTSINLGLTDKKYYSNVRFTFLIISISTFICSLIVLLTTAFLIKQVG